MGCVALTSEQKLLKLGEFGTLSEQRVVATRLESSLDPGPAFRKFDLYEEHAPYLQPFVGEEPKSLFADIIAAFPEINNKRLSSMRLISTFIQILSFF